MLPVLLRRRGRWQDPADLVRREFDRLFGLRWGEGAPEDGSVAAAYPVDITEDDDALVVEAEMPGFKREEIELTIDKGILSIKAERKRDEAKGTRHVDERMFTRIERAFSLPCPVDEDQIEARLADGVLHLRLPKTGEARPRRIEVA
jgi:HSP20 family molecular chaperone IbpA